MQSYHTTSYRLRTGFDRLDSRMGEIRNTDLILLGGRPGIGKTAFAASVAVNMVRGQGKRVAFFFLRPEGTGVLWRTALGKCPDIVAPISQADTLRRPGIFICDDAGSIEDIQNQTKPSQAFDFIVIDYLQLLGNSKLDKRLIEVLCQLKNMAEYLHTPFLVLTQLLRTTERRQCHIPKLTDLPRYRQIAELADTVLLFYRSQYYYDFYPINTDGVCIVEKSRRNIPGGTVLLWDLKNYFYYGCADKAWDATERVE